MIPLEESTVVSDLLGLSLGSYFGFVFAYVATGITLTITMDYDTSAMIGILAISLYMVKWWWNITQHYLKTDIWTFW